MNKAEDITAELNGDQAGPSQPEFNLKEAMVQHVVWAEGKRAFPYEDTVGKLTIGVGRNLTDRGLREDEIQLLLQNDLNEAMAEAEKLDFFEDLDDVRKLVIVDMIFNMGLPRFQSFVRTIAAIREKQYEAAAQQMADSKWFRQVGRRAQRLCQAMHSGVWQ